MSPRPPPLDGILETVLYARDLPRSTAFYRDVPGLPIVAGDGVRLNALRAGARQLLLLFQAGATGEPVPAPRGGFIPPHASTGSHHVGFASRTEDLAAWRAHLEAAGVEILSEAVWDRGGRSLFFHDPDGHLLELVTPGIWPEY
jgi:catechol 2,3-dioxygenase-like lactoylglutathione lyase family enzyme